MVVPVSVILAVRWPHSGVCSIGARHGRQVNASWDPGSATGTASLAHAVAAPRAEYTAWMKRLVPGRTLLSLALLLTVIPPSACSSSAPVLTSSTTGDGNAQDVERTRTGESSWLKQDSPVALRARIPGLRIERVEKLVEFDVDRLGAMTCLTPALLGQKLVGCAFLNDSGLDIELKIGTRTAVTEHIDMPGYGTDELEVEVRFDRWLKNDAPWALAVHISIEVEGVGSNSCDAEWSSNWLLLVSVTGDTAVAAPILATGEGRSQVLCDEEGAPREDWRETVTLEMTEAGGAAQIAVNRTSCRKSGTDCEVKTERLRWQPEGGIIEPVQ